MTGFDAVLQAFIKMTPDQRKSVLAWLNTYYGAADDRIDPEIPGQAPEAGQEAGHRARR